MPKPTVFRLRDFLTFGLACLVFTVIMLVVTLNGLNRGWGVYAAWSIPVAGWIAYGVYLYKRYRYVRSVSFVHRGISVMAQGFSINRDDFAIEVNRALNPFPMAAAKHLESLVVVFKPFPIVSLGKPYAGLYSEETAFVGYKDSLKTTALAHEIGHHLFFKVFNNTSAAAAHAFIATHID